MYDFRGSGNDTTQNRNADHPTRPLPTTPANDPEYDYAEIYDVEMNATNHSNMDRVPQDCDEHRLGYEAMGQRHQNMEDDGYAHGLAYCGPMRYPAIDPS